jgi:hypothetical protein
VGLRKKNYPGISVSFVEIKKKDVKSEIKTKEGYKGQELYDL